MSSPDDTPHELWGYLGDECFWRIQVTRDQWLRLVEFCKTNLSGIPNWVDLGPATAVDSSGEWSRREIATDDPKWFTTTYEKMIGPNAEY